MKTENNKQEEKALSTLCRKLQKDVNVILTDFEEYLEDFDDDSIKVHFDVDMVLTNSFISRRNNKKKREDSLKETNSHTKSSPLNPYNSEERVYNGSDFHSDFIIRKTHQRSVSNLGDAVRVLFRSI